MQYFDPEVPLDLPTVICLRCDLIALPVMFHHGSPSPKIMKHLTAEVARLLEAQKAAKWTSNRYFFRSESQDLTGSTSGVEEKAY